MNYITTTSLFLLLLTGIKAQKMYNYVDYKGDTTQLEVIENPTVCDCENIDWRNKEQEKVCNLTYDYDFMTEEEKKEYDKNRSICLYPTICDCANANKKNKGLLKVCNQNFNYASISEKQLQRNIENLKKCPKAKKEELSICDCINVEDYQLKKKCNETFFNDSLVPEEQRKENMLSMKKCIEEKKYDLNVSTCDCAKYEEKDEEYKKICDDKIEKLKSNKRELTEYLYDLKICKESQVLSQYLDDKNIKSSDRIHTVCNCAKEELEEKEKEKCSTIWDVETMTTEQQKAYTNTLNRCVKTTSKY